MACEESTSKNILKVSNPDDKGNLQVYQPEKWEINLIGNFVLGLYHRSIINGSNDFCIQKSMLREEYSKLKNLEIKQKLHEHNGTDKIATLLKRCGFLINTMRGSSYYKIKSKSLYDYRNNKLKELDNLKINMGIEEEKNDEQCDQLLINSMENNPIILEDNLEIDENQPKIPLEYQGTTILQRVQNFSPTNLSCCICEEHFYGMESFEEHIQIHGDATDFEFLNSMSKFDTPIFTMSYRMCKNSHIFCFEFETHLEDVIIEKIIIVQSRSFFYVHNMRVPYKCPEDGKDRFFVDSQLFTIHLEQAIILICHLENSKDSRLIEQHHFMRSEAFPKVNFSINPYRLPNKKKFAPKFQLPDYFPPKEIRDALRNDFYYENLIKMCNEFRDYVSNGKSLQTHTMGPSLMILLQIEDVDTMQQYLDLKQNNVKLRSYGDEYSCQLKPQQGTFLEQVVGVYDEIILTTRTDILTNTNEMMQLILKNKSEINRMKKTYVGQIQAVNTERISFKCDKNIDIHNSYTVICRPNRLDLRYQFRSLEQLTNKMHFLKNFLFPTNIIPMSLSSINVNLYNESLNAEQLQAVRSIAEGPRKDATYIIYGPPGTGKTATIVESILQILKKPDTKVLVTASSNSACDEIALRLFRYLKQLDMRRGLVRIFSRSCEKRNERIDDDLLENSNMYSGQFYPDIEILHEYRVVICTLSVVAKLATGNFGHKENAMIYSHLFIDEIAASTETEALMAITAVLTPSSCLIIAGDHKQLGPILKSERAKEFGLDASLMDRLLDRDCYRVDIDTGDYDRTIQTRLIRNYRSHPAIVKLFSDLYYNHSLKAFAKLDDVSLSEIWYKSRNKQYPIVFHAIYEPSKFDCRSYSVYNFRELCVVMDYVKDLMYFGINGKAVKESDIGIISPYKKQYTRIQEELNLRKWFGIETGSVETFQGKEKNIIIVSFARSGTASLGFLDNPRRLNVTISRAKSLLILIGNPKTLSLNSDFEYIIKECQRNNTFVGANNPLKQSTEHLCNSQENLTQLHQKLQEEEKALSVENMSVEKSTEIERKARRRRRYGRKKKGFVSENNEILNGGQDFIEDVDNKEYSRHGNISGEDDADEEDNGRDNKFKINSTLPTGNACDMRQLKKCDAASGDIISQESVKDMQSIKNLDKNKFGALIEELPQDPITSRQLETYAMDPLLQLQPQQQYCHNLQQSHNLEKIHGKNLNSPTTTFDFTQSTKPQQPSKYDPTEISDSYFVCQGNNTFVGANNPLKQSTEHLCISQENLTQLYQKLQEEEEEEEALSVENMNVEKVTEIKRKARRRRRYGRKKKGFVSENNEILNGGQDVIEDVDNKEYSRHGNISGENDADGEDNGRDNKFKINSTLPTNACDMRQLKKCGATSGDIISQESVRDMQSIKNLDKNKFGALIEELPQDHPITSRQLETETYAMDPLLQLQPQQQYCHNLEKVHGKNFNSPTTTFDFTQSTKLQQPSKYDPTEINDSYFSCDINPNTAISTLVFYQSNANTSIAIKRNENSTFISTSKGESDDLQSIRNYKRKENNEAQNKYFNTNVAARKMAANTEKVSLNSLKFNGNNNLLETIKTNDSSDTNRTLVTTINTRSKESENNKISSRLLKSSVASKPTGITKPFVQNKPKNQSEQINVPYTITINEKTKKISAKADDLPSTKADKISECNADKNNDNTDVPTLLSHQSYTGIFETMVKHDETAWGITINNGNTFRKYRNDESASLTAKPKIFIKPLAHNQSEHGNILCTTDVMPSTIRNKRSETTADYIQPEMAADIRSSNSIQFCDNKNSLESVKNNGAFSKTLNVSVVASKPTNITKPFVHRKPETLSQPANFLYTTTTTKKIYSKDENNEPKTNLYPVLRESMNTFSTNAASAPPIPPSNIISPTYSNNYMIHTNSKSIPISEVLGRYSNISVNANGIFNKRTASKNLSEEDRRRNYFTYRQQHIDIAVEAFGQAFDNEKPIVELNKSSCIIL